MEEEFLAENNPCGQALLTLVSRGNVILAELLRLKDHIPPVFKLESKWDAHRYSEVLLDFTYFGAPDALERKIESSETLSDVSNEVRDYYGYILQRFYAVYESVYKYITDLNAFVEELEDGTFIQQSMDTVFLSEDGVQLMCESVYLYGVMLIVIELYHPGTLRERLIVAYSRYNITVDTLDHVCQLVRSTGFMNTANAKRPLNYPTDLFKRVPVNGKLVQAVIGKLRTEDIYHQQKALPLPQHKTTALAAQSAILFVVLFFSPNTLHNQTARMREIVDKYFSDNWIVNVYMGISINLIDMWEPFKAARAALLNTIEPSNVKEVSLGMGLELRAMIKATDDILTEGVLTKDYLMDNVGKVLALARQANVVLRWSLLHTNSSIGITETVKKAKTVRDSVLVDFGCEKEMVLRLVLNTAEFENRVCDLFKSVLSEREDKWIQGKKESLLRVKELSEVFGGTKHIMRVKKSESLHVWFEKIWEEIDSLDLNQLNVSARKIAQLIKALEEVQGFQQMNNNLGVKQLATETCSLLKGMLTAVNVRDTLLVQMQIIGDFSYGWLLVDNYTATIQNGIKENPGLVHKLRAVFLKLSSAMETALLRINQAGDGDLPSVSQHYSSQLVLYVSRLLQVIPREVFRLMSEIAKIQTDRIPDVPARLQKDKLKEAASLDARFAVSRLTHELSVFSLGLLRMQSTLVGIIRVDPKELLEEGIRKELKNHMLAAFESCLSFNSKSKGSDLAVRLDELGATLEGHRNSFEYIQDYLNVNGLKMWQDELKKIMASKVEEDCRLLRCKGATLDLSTSTFLGRLCNQLVRITDPKTTFYSEHETCWVDLKTKAKLVDLKFFEKILRAVGVAGCVGLNHILGCLIVKHLQNITAFLLREAHNNKSWAETFGSIAKSLTPNTLTVDQPSKVYSNSVNRLMKLFTIHDQVLVVGQLQLLRKQISFTLYHTATVKARTYTSALSTLNGAYLLEVKSHLKNRSQPCPSPETLDKLSRLLDWVGLNDPFSQVYVTTKSVPYLSLFVFLFTIAHVPRFSYESSVASLTCKKTGEGLMPFIVGLHTLLKQFNVKVSSQFISYACQYTKSHMLSAAVTIAKPEIPPEALCMLRFLEEFIDVGELPRDVLTQHIPHFIFDLLSHGIAAYADS